MVFDSDRKNFAVLEPDGTLNEHPGLRNPPLSPAPWAAITARRTGMGLRPEITGTCQTTYCGGVSTAAIIASKSAVTSAIARPLAPDSGSA